MIHAIIVKYNTYCSYCKQLVHLKWIMNGFEYQQKLNVCTHKFTDCGRKINMYMQ